MGPTRTATETQDGTGGQERPRYALYYFKILSTLFLILLPTDCLFSTEYVNRRGVMGRERRGRDYVSSVPSSGGQRGGSNGYVFGHFCLLFSSSFLLAVFNVVVSFFAKITNRWAGAGPDRTDTDGDRNTVRDEGVNEYVPCHFLLSALFVSSPHFSSFSLSTVSTTIGRAGTRQNRTNAGDDRNTGRNSGSTGACCVCDLLCVSVGTRLPE